MLLLKTKYLVITSLAALLAACGGDSDLDKKSAKTLYQEATQQLYAKEAQFNFKADAKVDIGIENPFLTDLKVKLSGAVNNNAQRYELIPEVEAAIFNFKLPILVDAKKKDLLLNPTNIIDTALMFAPQANSELQQYKNKFVRFSTKNFEIDEEDMAKVITVVSEVVEMGYATMNEFTKIIPETSIEKIELNEKAKQINAKAILKVRLDEQQSKELQQHINTYLYNQVAENEKLPEEFKEGFMQGLLEANSDTGYESSESVLYLNDKGQIIHENDVFNYEIEGEKVSISMTIDYSNYGKASFTINPSENQIIDFTEEKMRSLQRM